MKKYLSRVLILLMLCIGVLSVIEVIARQAYDGIKFKYEWLKENAPELETLILGQSTLMWGIKPDIFDLVSFNAAFSCQCPQCDWMMMKSDTGDFRNLKNVILDIGSIFLNEGIPRDYAASYHYIGGKIFPLSWWYSFECSHIDRCRKKIKGLLFHCILVDKNIDGNGWRMMKSYCTKEMLEEHTLDRGVGRIWRRHADWTQKTINYADTICDYCQRHNVRIILLRSPLYPKLKYSFDNELGLSEKIDSVADRIILKYKNVEYRDYALDERFDFSDFSDAFHLNRYGAEKWTNILKNDFNL